MKKIYASLFVSLFVTSAYTQALFNNNGADIYVKDGGFVIVKTNSLYNNQVGGAGVIDNSGTIVVEGNITNDGAINATGDTIRLTGDWINNNSYTGNNSWVDIYGANQLITGSAITTFNNLNLGGGSVVKRQTVYAITTGELKLNDAELATDVNSMTVQNTNTNAITRNTGFVSSIDPGTLERWTSSSAPYLFPVGSPSYNNPPSIFRPVEFSTVLSTAYNLGATVVKGNATTDGYDLNKMDDQLCLVNPHFYHQFHKATNAGAVNVKMFFDPASDGDWTDQAQWGTFGKWYYLGAPTAGSGLGFSTVSVANVTDFAPGQFALARKKFTVDAGADVNLTLGQSATLNPTISAATVSSYAWTPAIDLTCNNCQSPDAAPTVTTQYLITVIDDAGCIVSDSLVIKISNPELLIPTAFSPNGDGVNDAFKALNKN